MHLVLNYSHAQPDVLHFVYYTPSAPASHRQLADIITIESLTRDGFGPNYRALRTIDYSDLSGITLRYTRNGNHFTYPIATLDNGNTTRADLYAIADCLSVIYANAHGYRDNAGIIQRGTGLDIIPAYFAALKAGTCHTTEPYHRAAIGAL